MEGASLLPCMCRWHVYKICVNDLHASKCLFFYVLLLFIYIFFFLRFWYDQKVFGHIQKVKVDQTASRDPISEAHFTLYLLHLADASKSRAAVEEAVSMISWIQQLANDQPVSAAPIIKATLSGLQQILAKPKTHKEPIMAAMLTRMVGSLGSEPKLSDICLMASSLLAYATFLRYQTPLL